MQKLEALGQMTGTAAHDFNNLMGVVSGGIRLARRKIKDAEALHLLDTVADAVQRGTKITQQMLAFASQQKLDVVESNVNELLINLKELLCRAAGSHVAIVYDLADDVPRCMTDRTQFDTAVINLVINARDAMPDAGVIRISTSRFLGEERKLTGRIRAGPCACVTVTDNGQGMSPDVQRRALEPFFTTKGEKGTGLGLSQVYGFVRQNGGDMIIESEAGKGTSIHLLFPGIEDRSSLPPQGERQYTREAMQQPIGEMSAVLHQVAIRGSLSRRPTIALQMRPRHRETIA